MKCELCGSTDKVFPHLHYEEHYQYPRFMIICRRCHQRIHHKSLDKELFCTIRVRKSTLERLKRFGRMGDSYDDVLCRLLDIVEQKVVKEKNEFEFKFEE